MLSRKNRTAEQPLTAEEKQEIAAEFAENGQGEPIFPESPVVASKGTEPEADAADAALLAVATPVFGQCGCGCGIPVRRRFLPGHDARLASAQALAARAKRSHSTIEQQMARDLENRKARTAKAAKARRQREKAEYAAAVAEAAAVMTETPEETAQAVKAQAA